MAPTTCNSVTRSSGPRMSFRSRTSASSSSSSTTPAVNSTAASDRCQGSMAKSNMTAVGRPSGSRSVSKTPRKITGGGNNKAARANAKKSVYKHVPHAMKPVHLVAKRNARERRRVQAVNSAFLRLRKHVPYEPRHKRLSKVKTLRVAITYISHLQDMIREHDRRLSTRQHHAHLPHQHQHHHLNMLAEASSTSSSAVVNISDNINVYDNNYQFINRPCTDDVIGSQQGRGIAPHHNGLSSSSSSSASSSHFLHASPQGTAHGTVSTDHLSGSWSDGLHYTGPTENTKMPACPSDNPLYYLPSCPPQHYDVTNNGGYISYDTFSVQSPYQLLR